MAKTIQYANNHWVKFERKRGLFKNKWHVFDFGAVFFEVQAWIFEQLIIFQAPASVFISRCLLKCTYFMKA